MPERFANDQWPGRPECGVWNVVFWIAVGLVSGVVVGLAAWAIWGTR